MKSRILIIILVMSVTSSFAQRAEEPQGSFLEESHPTVKMSSNAIMYNEFSGMQMSYEKGWITFSGFPDLKKKIDVYVTNADGEVVKTGAIHPQKESIDVEKLKKGMYFVTLMYRQSSRKAFVLHID